MVCKMNKELTNSKTSHANRKTTTTKSQNQTTKKRVMLKGGLSGKRYQRCSSITDLETDLHLLFSLVTSVQGILAMTNFRGSITTKERIIIPQE